MEVRRPGLSSERRTTRAEEGSRTHQTRPPSRGRGDAARVDLDEVVVAVGVRVGLRLDSDTVKRVSRGVLKCCEAGGSAR